MVGTRANYEVRVDGAKNRLFMTLEGMLDEEMAGEVVEELAEAVERLEPGFDVVNDISSFKPMSQDATDSIERGKRVVAGAGVSAVARVVGDSVIGKMQFDRVEPGDVTYHVTTAESVAQAEAFLDEFRRQRGE